jgi:Trk-type K+ transport system membrane component
LYFILTILISSLIFWLSSRPERSINYVDCLFMVTTAMTETGLNTVNLSQINTFQQVFLFLLMISGSPIFVSYFVVLVRKRAFELRFSELVQVYKADKKDITHDLGNSLHVLFHSSSHPEEQ